MDHVAEWMTPGKAARALDVSPQWINKLIKEGRLRAVRTGLGHLIDPASVEALIKERCRKRERTTIAA